MENQEALLATIHACIDELNQQLPEGGRLLKAPDTILLGEGGALDSLGLITLLVNAEQALLERHGMSVALLDELMAEHAGPHPFSDLAGLLVWVSQRKSAATQTR